jgi:glycerol kinase
MQSDGIDINAIRVDGGMVANDWVCQCLADILDLNVVRPTVNETTALGAAYLAGIQVGIYNDLSMLAAQNPIDKTFDSVMCVGDRNRKTKQWEAAIAATKIYTEQSS